MVEDGGGRWTGVEGGGGRQFRYFDCIPNTAIWLLIQTHLALKSKHGTNCATPPHPELSLERPREFLFTGNTAFGVS